MNLISMATSPYFQRCVFLAAAMSLNGLCGYSEFLMASEKIAVVIQGQEESELAPHRQGNVYAPEVLVENGKYRMWYGGQGSDGHDRIHYAESQDGIVWQKKVVVLEDPNTNHVNDPSVVKSGEQYFMYYTVASSGVTDRIDVATSTNGIDWEKVGTALNAGNINEWDGLLVGRPSVLVENGIFKMWYDGRKDLPMNAPDKAAPKSTNSRRAVGYATSSDGIHWTKTTANPVFGNDAGGIHVSRMEDKYVMVYESTQGTMTTTSKDGISWGQADLHIGKSVGELDSSGHVTPFLLNTTGSGNYIYTGAAQAASWDRNCIVRIAVPKK